MIFQNLLINYKNLSKLLLDLKKCVINNLHFAGNSFSNKQLVLGNIYLYYIQFVSNIIFNVPNAFQPFLLNKKLKKSIMKFVDSLIDSFYDKHNLETFIKNQFTIDSSNNIIFNVSCIQFLLKYHLILLILVKINSQYQDQYGVLILLLAILN